MERGKPAARGLRPRPAPTSRRPRRAGSKTRTRVEQQRLAKQKTELLVASLHRRIVAQLRSVQAAYADLETAALNADAAAFEAAKRVVRAREAALKEFLLELRFAGISTQ